MHLLWTSWASSGASLSWVVADSGCTGGGGVNWGSSIVGGRCLLCVHLFHASFASLAPLPHSSTAFCPSGPPVPLLL